jgi:hypothetical protein
MSERTAGLVVKVADELRFIPATVARQVVPRRKVSEVPGEGLSMALIGGRVLAVVDVDAPQDHLVVCSLAGEEVAFSGLAVLSAGVYETVRENIRFAEQLVAPFDLAQRLQAIPRRLWQGRQHPGDGA